MKRALLFLSLLAMSVQGGFAFCPNNGWRCGFGVAGTTHKDMTKQAIKELDAEFFSTSKLTKSMKKAIEEIWEADAAVDENQMESRRHFDGENFDGSKNRILLLEDDIVSALQAEDGSGARKALGGALHTVQDFYSHSNFIERGNSGAYPAIWQEGQPISPLASKTDPTCKDCDLITLPDGTVITDCSSNIITSLITSGYYGKEDAKPLVGGKCRHGGILDSGPGPFGGINKDTLFATFSPHNFQHGAAASSALAATKQFVRDIKDRITRRQLKLLLGVGPTLAMAIDTTGSMGSIIASVRQQAIQIVDARIGTDQEPLLYVLSPFNDPFTGPLTVTDDAGTFKSAISALGASGGGDCPELSMTGSLQALSASDEGVDLFTWTDADAKDASRAGAVSSLEDAKDAKTFPMLFGTCTFLASQDQGDTSSLGPVPIDPAYTRIAGDSGGQVFFLARSEAGRITQLADAVVRANAVDVLSVADVFGASPKVYSVPVDSTLTQITFSLSGSTSLTLTRPDGTTVAPGDPDVKAILLSTASIFTVVNPQAGSWTVSASGFGDYSLSVLGESPLDLDRFDFVEVRGQGGHEGYFPLEGFPVSGDPSTASAELSGDFATAAFDLRSKAGDVLATLSLGQEPGGATDEFYGPVTLPAAPFLVYATGTLASGERFQRLLTKKVQPQTVRVFAPLTQDLVPGQSLSYTFRVKNFGPDNVFSLTASDDRGFVGAVSPTSFALKTGEMTNVTVRLDVPSGTAEGTSETLTVNVESTAPAGARNFAVVQSTVVNRPVPTIDCGQAAPSVASLWPPNHQLSAVGINGLTSSDGTPVHVQVSAVQQSEPTNGTGDGDTCPDAQGIGTPAASLRAERSGNGPGRLYTVFFAAQTDTGGSCQGSVTVCVPHDNHGSCAAAPTTFDSTACP